MHKCPANPAPSAEKPTGEQQSEHGTGQPISSGQEGLTLFERLMLENIRILIDQQDEIIGLLVDGNSEETDDEPSRYLNGQRVS